MKNLKKLYEKEDEKAWQKIQIREIKQRKNERCRRRKGRLHEELF